MVARQPLDRSVSNLALPAVVTNENTSGHMSIWVKFDIHRMSQAGEEDVHRVRRARACKTQPEPPCGEVNIYLVTV